jgi:serine/threonine protein kinase/tetratricopeptide (TPR) repeat protein
MTQATRIVDRSYVLHEKLGEGGMGTVYRATRRVTGSVVALKLVGPLDASGSSPDALYQMRLALAREFQTLSSLHHPHVIQVLDHGFDDALGPYFTMDLLDAPRTVLEAAAGRPPAERVRILAELCRALVYLHRRGIIHRDIKPSNVLWSGGAVKVLDFGLATATPQDASVAGTLAYMAPELLVGHAPGVASDLYAVGVLALEMLRDAAVEVEMRADDAGIAHATTSPLAVSAGSSGGVAATTQVLPTGAPRALSPVAETYRKPRWDLHEVLRAMVPPKVTAAGPLGDILRRLLAPRPSDRYPSVEELLGDLGRAVGEELPIETVETRESFLSASEFVGREEEMGALRRALDRALHGGPGAGFLIGGESGVGKSRLTAELRTIAMVRGAWVAEGQAVATGGGSYQVWLPVLRALCLRADLDDASLAALKELLPELPALLARPVPDAPPLPAAAAQSRLLGAVEALFKAQDKPTVVLVEDLQWAGADSLDLLDRLSRLTAAHPLLLVGNYRNDEAPELPAAAPDMARLDLSRLGRAQVERLSRSMLGAAGEDPALVEYLCRETEGNVFFLVEVVRALAEQAGQLDRVRRAEAPSSVLTGGIGRLAQRRVDRVPPEGRRLLELCATLGRQLDLAVLARVAPGVDPRAFLFTCANAAVLESSPGGLWRFSHDKLREALLARLSAEARREHHRTVGEAIEAVYEGGARDARSAALAHHFDQAGDHERAFGYHLRAGDLATRLCAYDEARRHYAAAITCVEALPPSDARSRRKVDALLKLVYTRLVADAAEQNFARMAEARALLDAIAAEAPLDAADRIRLARVNYVVGRIHFYRGEAREAIGYYREVLPFAKESGDPELMALPACLIGTAMLAQGNMRKAEPLLGQSIAPLEHLGEPFEWFRAVGYHGASLIALGRYREGIAELERVLARAQEIGQPSLASAAHLMSGSAYLLSGDWPLVLQYHAKVLELAARTGDKLHLSLAHSSIGWALAHLGRAEEAEESRAEGQAIARAMGGRLMLADWYEAGDAEIALHAGRLDDALALAERLAAASASAGLPFSRGVAERVTGVVLAERGRHEDAAARFAASVEILEASGNVLQAARTRAAWSEACRARGAHDDAAALLAAARDVLSRAGCAYALAELGGGRLARDAGCA